MGQKGFDRQIHVPEEKLIKFLACSKNSTTNKEGPVISLSLSKGSRINDSEVYVVLPHFVRAYRTEDNTLLREYKTDLSGPVFCAAAFCPRSALGDVIIGGQLDGRLLILSSVSFEIEKLLSVPQQSGDNDLSVLTSLIVPFDNLIICGFKSGKVCFLSLDKGEITHCLTWDDHICPHLSHGNVYAQKQMASNPSPIRFLGHQPDYHKFLLIGFQGKDIFTNSDLNGQTEVLDVTPPVFIVKLSNFENPHAVIWHTNKTVVHIAIQDSDSYGSLLIVVGSFSLSVFPFDQHDVAYRKHSLCHVQYFGSVISPSTNLYIGSCYRAVHDQKHKVLFLAFTEGLLFLLTFSRQNEDNVVCNTYRRLKV